MTYVMVGDGSGPKFEARIRPLNFGRVWVSTRSRNVQLYPGEQWGLDNGAFGAWKKGEPWDGGAFMENTDRYTESAGRLPLWAALPDVVDDWPETVRRADYWLGRVRTDLPWYLCLQDGAEPTDVDRFVGDIDGLFFGGTDDFKPSAEFWCQYAHDRGLRFHYGRASRETRIVTAHRIGADSLDSTQGMWSQVKWRTFVRSVEKARTQLELGGVSL